MTSPKPGMNKPSFNKPAKPIVRPGKPMTPVIRPSKPSTMPVDESKLFRKLPITEKDLRVIKKHYGIK